MYIQLFCFEKQTTHFSDDPTLLHITRLGHRSRLVNLANQMGN